MQKNRVFGGRCCESLASYDQESQSWRTYQISFDWGDSTFSDPLPPSGIMRNGQLYPLECLGLPIFEKDGSASAILPTPLASDVDKQSTGGLHRLIVKGGKYSKGDHRYKNLPTPQAHNAKETGSPADFRKNSLTLIGHFIEPDTDIGKRPRLSPHFVTWMMGFPIDWLD